MVRSAKLLWILCHNDIFELKLVTCTGVSSRMLIVIRCYCLCLSTATLVQYDVF